MRSHSAGSGLARRRNMQRTVPHLIPPVVVPRWDTGGMCLACAASETALLSEVERLVVLAEAEAGLGDPAARRPLSGPERESRVRFSEITALEDGYLEAVTPVLEELRRVVDAEVVAALAGATTAAALLDALEALTASQPPRVADTAAEAARAVETALQAVYQGSSAVAIGEARRQGVTRFPEPLQARAGAYQVAARRVAQEPWARALEVTRKQVTSPTVLASTVLDADLVPAALADYSNAGTIDLARQFEHGALNAGRFDTVEHLPFESAYCSELLDANTCSRCRAIDGEEVSTLAELRSLYPNGGGYYACEGGARCRGTGVIVYRT